LFFFRFTIMIGHSPCCCRCTRRAARTAAPLDRPTDERLRSLDSFISCRARQRRHFRFLFFFFSSATGWKRNQNKQTESNGERVCSIHPSIHPRQMPSVFCCLPDPWTKVPLWLKGITSTATFLFLLCNSQSEMWCFIVKGTLMCWGQPVGMTSRIITQVTSSSNPGPMMDGLGRDLLP